MNTETFHDALSLLPEDLVAEAMEARRAKKVIPWKRVLPIAACLCLILLTAPAMAALLAPKGAMETAQDCALAEAAPQMEAAMDEVYAESHAEDAPAEEEPALKRVQSSLLMDNGAGAYACLRYATPLRTDSATDSLAPMPRLIHSQEELDGYLDAARRTFDLSGLDTSFCGEGWFESQDLLIYPMEDAASMTLESREDGTWVLTPHPGGDGWAHLLLPLAKDTVPVDAAITIAPMED